MVNAVDIALQESEQAAAELRILPVLPGFAVYADTLVQAEQGFNFLVLARESAGINFGHHNRRQQENALRFQQLDKTRHSLRLLF